MIWEIYAFYIFSLNLVEEAVKIKEKFFTKAGQD